MKPAETCLLCGKPFEKNAKPFVNVSGLRIVATTVRGAVWVTETKEIKRPGLRMGDREELIWKEVETDRGMQYLQISGRFAREEAISRAIEMVKQDSHPWACMECAGYRCNVCGGRLNYAPGAESIADNGAILHNAILPFQPTCVMKGCPASRTNGQAEADLEKDDNSRWHVLTGVSAKDMATVQEVLAYIEQQTGLRLIAYDQKEDSIVYGGELIDELVVVNEE